MDAVFPDEVNRCMNMTGKEAIDKKLQRKLAVEKRRALTQEERDEKSRAICDLLIKLIKDPRYSGVRTIFSYRGTWDEVNVDAFNDWAEVQGYRVAYPISLPNGIMKAAVPAEENAWHRAAYGIFEPVMENSKILEPEDIDLVIVPCVAPIGIDASPAPRARLTIRQDTTCFASAAALAL